MNETLQKLLPGIQLGEYEIVRLIGSGGMGEVYETIYTGLDKPVSRAIKTIPQLVAKDSKALKRLKKEVRLAQELSHPNIVKTYSMECFQDIHFIVMEYVNGYDLHEYLEKNGGQLSLNSAINSLKGIAEALDYAHGLQHAVIHRDLKPQNCLFDIESGQLKITDFGVAEVGDTITTMSQVSMNASGTPRYMSYEQFMGDIPSPSMDNYSLGIIMYELLKGEPPFVRGDMMAQHKEKEIPDIPKISKHAMNALKKCLAKKPEDRFSTSLSFLEALQGKSISKTMITKVNKVNEEISTNSKTDDILAVVRFIIENELISKDNLLAIDELQKIKISDLTSESEKGNDAATFLLGLKYYYGLNCNANREKSSEYILKAAEENSYAVFFLATWYMNGTCFEKDIVKGIELIKHSASLGNTQALYSLGKLHISGYKVRRDPKEGFLFMMKAAEKGHRKAQFSIGQSYENGIGINKNINEAIKWYERSADQGYEKAIKKMGIFYLTGYGVLQNEELAKELLAQEIK